VVEVDELRSLKVRLATQSDNAESQFWSKARIGPEDVDAAIGGLNFESFRELSIIT